jgi:hypothetical protein
LVLTLGNPVDPAKAPWLQTMIATLIADRQYDRAKMLWDRTAGISASSRTTGLFDPAFRNSTALPPFNWKLTSSSLGLAERRSGGLQVIFYGQDSGVLAQQLVLLPPGRYRLSARATGGDDGNSLHWRARCDASSLPELGQAPIRQGGMTFAVPGNCPAIWIELIGRASDFGRQVETSIGPLSLAKATAQ